MLSAGNDAFKRTDLELLFTQMDAGYNGTEDVKVSTVYISIVYAMRFLHRTHDRATRILDYPKSSSLLLNVSNSQDNQNKFR